MGRVASDPRTRWAVDGSRANLTAKCEGVFFGSATISMVFFVDFQMNFWIPWYFL